MAHQAYSNSLGARELGLGALAHVPDYVVNMVLLQLDLPSLARTACVSRVLRVWCAEETLWQQACLQLELPFAHQLVYEARCADHIPCALMPEPKAGLSLTAQNGLSLQGSWRRTALALLAEHAPEGTCRPDAASIQAAERPPPPVAMHSDFLYRRWLRSHMDLQGFLPPVQGVAHVDARALSPLSCREAFDGPCKPAVLTHAADDWPQDVDWSLAGLASRWGDAVLHVSKPGLASGRAVMRLDAYHAYASIQADEEPLYIFDASFGEAAPELLRAYSVPVLFDQDFYGVLGGERPPFRWLVAGPARSGASWHVDPKLTSAWNALCTGRKRWALYPPGVVPPGVQLIDTGPGDVGPDDAYTSLQWYLEVYPCLPPHQRPIEFVQEPGEVVFVPGGWWHLVLNLDESVAVTQNFVSEGNLDRVVAYMAHGSPHYFNNLEAYHPASQLQAWAKAHTPPDDLDDAASSNGAGSSDWDTISDSDSEGSETELETFEALGLDPAGCEPPCTHVRVVFGDDEASGVAAPDGGAAGEQGATLLEVWEARYGLPVTTFYRDRQLGPWLSRLLHEHPRLQPAVAAALQRSAGLDAWADALRAIAAATAPNVPHNRDHGAADGLQALLPRVGADSLVFLGQEGGRAIKLIVEQAKAVAGLMCVSEFAVPQLLGLRPGPGPPRPAEDAAATGMADASFPQACSTVWVDTHGVLDVAFPNGSNGPPAAPPRRQLFPFLVMEDLGQRLGGWQPLSRTWPTGGADAPARQQHLAAALGRMLAELHVRGYLAAGGACKAEGEGVEAQGWWRLVGSRQAWWHDREGNVWTAGEGWVIRDGRRVLPDATTPGNGHTEAGALDAQSLLLAAEATEAGVGSGWRPFLSFLRHRRSEAETDLADAGVLPSSLQRQVATFLPPDVADLIGDVSPASGAAPLLLHGDLNARNIWAPKGRPTQCNASPDVPAHAPGPTHALGSSNGQAEPMPPVTAYVSAATSPPLAVLDWGDAGWGDPLFDWVPMHTAVFRCDPCLLAPCWATYREHLLPTAQALLAARALPTSSPAAHRLAACADGAAVLRLLWPPRAAASSPWGRLSRVAMAYMLMHEEAATIPADVWAGWIAACGKGGRAATLDDVASHIWGQLDVV